MATDPEPVVGRAQGQGCTDDGAVLELDTHAWGVRNGGRDLVEAGAGRPCKCVRGGWSTVREQVRQLKQRLDTLDPADCPPSAICAAIPATEPRVRALDLPLRWKVYREA